MRRPVDHSQVFIVRLSAVLQTDGPLPRWALRGQVEHTRTGQAWRFVSLEDLQHILEVCMQGSLDGEHIPPQDVAGRATEEARRRRHHG